MAVKSPVKYPSIHRDRQEGYGPVQILYFCWEGHLLFAAPSALVAPPTTSLRDVLEGQLMNIIKIDPDAAKIEWEVVEWVKKGETVTLDLDRSLEENGLRHKDQIMLRTPGFATVCAA